MVLCGLKGLPCHTQRWYSSGCIIQPDAFQWHKQSNRYLGILFPPQFKDLVKVILIHKISWNVNRWAALNLSKAGKINVVNMKCIPKLNFLMYSLPLEVPLSYFRWFDRITKTFILNRKLPWLHFSKLQRTDRGGLGSKSASNNCSPKINVDLSCLNVWFGSVSKCLFEYLAESKVMYW